MFTWPALMSSAVSPPLCLQAMCASLALCQIVLVMCQPFQHSLPRVSLPMCPCVLFARLNWLFIYWTLLWLSKDWAYELLPDLPRRACKSHSAMLWSLQWMFFFLLHSRMQNYNHCMLMNNAKKHYFVLIILCVSRKGVREPHLIDTSSNRE